VVSKANRKYWRTCILGLLAMGTLIWTAVDQFDIPVEEMKALFYTTLIVVGAIILLAALVVALWIGLRYLFRSNS
jgi:succinate dehydrogenase/fumarate reductase cytochrome b subunit